MESSSTTTQQQQQQQQQQQHASKSKLPIKRKTLDEPKTAPFKFHRIWTEPDEIRFLQGLLDCSSLCFPRDLGIFYSRFSNTMSQPYTKSQLSEKLRRLRKKFRIISTRLSKGMDQSQLSLHDRALYDLSTRLWHPDFATTSPFFTNNMCHSAGLVGIKVHFSPTLPPVMDEEDRDHVADDLDLDLDFVDDEMGEIAFGAVDHHHHNNNNNDGEIKLSEVNVEFEGEEEEGFCGVRVRQDQEKIAQAVVDVFEDCLQQVRVKMRIQCRGYYGDRESSSFQLRWQQQRLAELDAVGNRLRLVLEHSLLKQ